MSKISAEKLYALLLDIEPIFQDERRSPWGQGVLHAVQEIREALDYGKLNAEEDEDNGEQQVEKEAPA